MDDMWKCLSKARLEQSLQCLKSARILLEHEDYRGAANRSYYAIFHAMRSVLALDNKDFSKHAGVISCFRKDYLKTGELPRDLPPIITLAFEVRSDCDYDDYSVIEKDEVVNQINNASLFYKLVQEYVLARIGAE